MAPKL